LKNNAIGIFDSGIGGLTVANAVYKLLPNEQIIYFGDTAHLPYGDQSPEAIQSYCEGISDFLLEKKCKAIVIACNTASSVAYESLRKQLPKSFPLIDVIGPTVRKVSSQGSKKVGVIGTKRTIESNLYSDKLKLADDSIDVVSKATRSLATIIEEGFFKSPEVINSILSYYLADNEFQSLDGLILACTHYPIIKKEIEAYYKDEVHIYDSPAIVAQYLKDQLTTHKLLNDSLAQQAHEFYVSDYTEMMNSTTSIFFDANIKWVEEDIWS